jgi:Ser/Thr protein kinase RdoA (MazF antagonist)
MLWRCIPALVYGQRSPVLEEVFQCYSLHFRYWEGRTRYVLSRVRKDPRRIPFSTQFELLDMLGGRLPEVCRPLSRPGQSQAWFDTFRHHWFVRTYTDHTPIAGNCEYALISHAAGMLARVHDAAGALWTDRCPERFDPDRLDPYYWSAWDVVERMPELLARSGLGCLPKAGADLVRAVGCDLTWCEDWARLGPVGVTHQDFRPENVLVREGRIVEVIDWDRARPDYQVFDAILAGLQFARCGGGTGLHCARDFVQIYLQARALDIDADVLDHAFLLAAVKGACVSRTPTKWVSVLRALTSQEVVQELC